MKKLVGAMLGLLVFSGAGVPTIVSAQTCPPVLTRQYAVVKAVEDLEIVQADETIEVADEWLNGCSDAPPNQTHTSQVMWLFDPGSTARLVEIGVRRQCSGGNVVVKPYYSQGTMISGGSASAFPRYFKNGSVDVTVNPATRVDVTMKNMGQISGESANRWQFRVSFGGSTYEARASVTDAFEPIEIHVGGENMTDLHDMGISGHLNTRYQLQNQSLLFLKDRTVTVSEDAPRYVIWKGTGGFGGASYFQTHTDIHTGSPAPTAVPGGFDMCLGE